MGGRMLTFTYVAALSGLVAWSTIGTAESILQRLGVSHCCSSGCGYVETCSWSRSSSHTLAFKCLYVIMIGGTPVAIHKGLLAASFSYMYYFVQGLLLDTA
jgi:hypothetical protein